MNPYLHWLWPVLVILELLFLRVFTYEEKHPRSQELKPNEKRTHCLLEGEKGKKVRQVSGRTCVLLCCRLLGSAVLHVRIKLPVRWSLSPSLLNKEIKPHISDKIGEKKPV